MKRPKPYDQSDEPVGSDAPPRGGHTLEDIDFTHPGIVEDIRRVFAVLAKVPVADPMDKLAA